MKIWAKLFAFLNIERVDPEIPMDRLLLPAKIRVPADLELFRYLATQYPPMYSLWTDRTWAKLSHNQSKSVITH